MAWSDELLARYQAATTTSTHVPLPGWTTVRISGADRVSFLHNMCTNDIKGLPGHQQCEAFLTDVKGKIVGHVIVFAEAEQLLLLTVPRQAERIMSSLERYVIREDVQLSDETAKFGWILHVGPETSNRLREQSVGLRLEPECILASCAQIWPGGVWTCQPRGPEIAEVWNPTDDDVLLWHALRIESGWPLFGVDFDGSNLPQEVVRNAQAISFRKGCYLGQETIARIDALGHVNKQLATVRFAEVVPVGGELTSGGEVVGQITSASYSPHFDAWLALAMIKRGHNAAGDRLECANQIGEVVPTPAVAP